MKPSFFFYRLAYAWIIFILFACGLETVQFWVDENPLLGGPLNPNIGSLPSLESLSLSECNWSGTLPEQFGSLGSSIDNIFLNDNDLSGSIPESFGNLVMLSVLTLLGNPRMTGILPLNLCLLTFGPLQTFTAECDLCLSFTTFPCCDNMCP